MQHQTRQIAPSPGTHPHLGDTATSHGSVYWYELSARRTHRFVLETGAASVIGPSFPSHPAPALVVTPSGVYWVFGPPPGQRYRLLTAFPLPGPVRSKPALGPTNVYSDGSGYVWQTAEGMRWWRPGEATSHLIPVAAIRAGGLDGALVATRTNDEYDSRASWTCAPAQR